MASYYVTVRGGALKGRKLLRGGFPMWTGRESEALRFSSLSAAAEHAASVRKLLAGRGYVVGTVQIPARSRGR